MARAISVVICAYDEGRWDLLQQAVDSVRRQHRKADEIIVVVDHNAALLSLARANLDGVRVVNNDDARGLSGARNSGVRAAGGDIIAFLDDDAVASDDWLGWLESGYLNPLVAGVGGSINPAWESGRPEWFPEEFDWVVGCTYRGMPEGTDIVRNLIGANMSYSRDALIAGGAFRSGIGRVGTLPVGCEETELCIRISQQMPESIFLYEPRARVSHHVPASRSNFDYFRRRCLNEGRSKALVTAHVGSRTGLSTESQYTFRTLPAGVGRSVARAVRNTKPTEMLRGFAIVAGLAVTTIGYLSGRVGARKRPPSAQLEPATDVPWITNAVVTDRSSIRR